MSLDCRRLDLKLFSAVSGTISFLLSLTWSRFHVPLFSTEQALEIIELEKLRPTQHSASEGFWNGAPQFLLDLGQTDICTPALVVEKAII